MASLLEEIFPQTVHHLEKSERSRIEGEFLKSFELPKDAGYFPMMMKRMNLSESLVQVADYEYLQWQVAGSEELVLRSVGPYVINSTLQWVILESGATLLNKPKGFYALWKFQGEVFETMLSLAEAEKILEIQEHPELVPLESENRMIQQLISRGLIRRTSFSP